MIGRPEGKRPLVRGRGCAYGVLLGRPEGKRPLVSPRNKLEDSLKMALKKVGLRGVDWIGLAQNMNRWRVKVNAVINLRVP